jgi:hypothetical protein
MESLVALLIERPFLSCDKNSKISGFCSHFMVEGRPPRGFSAPVAIFMGRDSAFIPTQGTGRSGSRSHAVSDKQLM